MAMRRCLNFTVRNESLRGRGFFYQRGPQRRPGSAGSWDALGREERGYGLCVPRAGAACRGRCRKELAGRTSSSLHGRHTGEGLGEGLELDTWAGHRVESALKEPWVRDRRTLSK